MRRGFLSIAVAAIILMTIAACATGKDPDQKADPKSALFKAIQDNDLAKVKAALAAGADPNAANSLGGTPLWIAETTNNIELAKIVLDAGADINKRMANTCKDTMLIIALRDQQMDFAKFLIERGADINARNERDAVPLHLAVCKNKKEMVELLISKGAELKVKGTGDRGDTPLEKARRRKFMDIATILEKAGG